ncbi:MAG: hypothetical protein EXQ86_09315 [Rhodospirillales bacterium]|nr:hypothetical protein [Rhodospirillales bacterium]
MLTLASRARGRKSVGYFDPTLVAAGLALVLWAPGALLVCAPSAQAAQALANEHFSRDIDPAATERLFLAVEKNDLAAVQKAVAEGGDLAATNPAGRTPADIAVDKGHYAIAHFLLAVRNFQEKDAAHRPPADVVQELTKDQPKPKASTPPVPLARGKAASAPPPPPASTTAPKPPAMPAQLTPPLAAPALQAERPKDDDRPKSRYFGGLSSFDPTPRASAPAEAAKPAAVPFVPPALVMAPPPAAAMPAKPEPAEKPKPKPAPDPKRAFVPDPAPPKPDPLPEIAAPPGSFLANLREIAGDKPEPPAREAKAKPAPDSAKPASDSVKPGPDPKDTEVPPPEMRVEPPPVPEPPQPETPVAAAASPPPAAAPPPPSPAALAPARTAARPPESGSTVGRFFGRVGGMFGGKQDDIQARVAQAEAEVRAASRGEKPPSARAPVESKPAATAEAAPVIEESNLPQSRERLDARNKARARLDAESKSRLAELEQIRAEGAAKSRAENEALQKGAPRSLPEPREQLPESAPEPSLAAKMMDRLGSLLPGSKDKSGKPGDQGEKAPPPGQPWPQAVIEGEQRAAETKPPAETKPAMKPPAAPTPAAPSQASPSQSGPARAATAAREPALAPAEQPKFALPPPALPGENSFFNRLAEMVGIELPRPSLAGIGLAPAPPPPGAERPAGIAAPPPPATGLWATPQAAPSPPAPPAPAATSPVPPASIARPGAAPALSAPQMMPSGRSIIAAQEQPPAPLPEPPALEPEDVDPSAWAVRSIQMAQAPIHVPRPAATTPAPPNALNGVVFSLGRSIGLGRVYGSGHTNCIEKQQGMVTFCVEPVDWPENLGPRLLTGTVMYQGLSAIARYDEGQATRYHALFESDVFDAIVAYYTKRFGPPLAQATRSMKPMASAARENPVVSWRSLNPTTQEVAVLEVRKFDDSRGSFPDTKRGAIMLYTPGSDHIFPQVSTIELMQLRTR